MCFLWFNNPDFEDLQVLNGNPMLSMFYRGVASLVVELFTNESGCWRHGLETHLLGADPVQPLRGGREGAPSVQEHQKVSRSFWLFPFWLWRYTRRARLATPLLPSFSATSVSLMLLSIVAAFLRSVVSRVVFVFFQRQLLDGPVGLTSVWPIEPTHAFSSS